jgi:hypothetical protein
MVKSDIETLLDKALSTPLGIAVLTSGYNAALALRRKMYNHRDKLRNKGNLNFDTLSFIAKPNGELHLIKRAEAMDSQIPSKCPDTRELGISDCPKNIITRGKHKPGLISEALMQELFNTKLTVHGKEMQC